MKKFCTFALLFLLGSTTVFAQNQLAQKYRPGMLPLFVEYAKIGSMSDNYAEWMTPGQEEMANRLMQDITDIVAGKRGFHVHRSADNYIYVNIDSNLTRHQIPTLGISAHYDTTPDINGDGIQPHVITNYQGGPIPLTHTDEQTGEEAIVDYIDPQNPQLTDNAYLNKMIGKTIVTSDGTTNLGADDKAGVTIVITLLKTLAENPRIKHGPIDILLAPNEDVGRAAERINQEYKEWKARQDQALKDNELFDEPAPPLYYNPDYAYDFDGGIDGQVVLANFRAEKIIVTIQGIGGHQSNAFYNGYRNAVAPLAYIISATAPVDNLPNHSRNDEGYIEPYNIEYDLETHVAMADFRFRYFDKQEGEDWRARILGAVAAAQVVYDVEIDVQIILQYDNVENGVKTESREIIESAMSRAGVTPHFKKERAGTTSAMIMATQGFGGYTIFTGQVNPHKNQEWLSEEDMFKSYEVALNLITEMAKRRTDSHK